NISSLWSDCMLVRDLMTIYPVSISIHSDLRRAAEIVSLAGASDLMVVDTERRFLGVLSEGDLIRAIMPNFDEVLEAGGTLDDAFNFFIRKGKDLASRPIEPLVIKNPIVVSPTDEAAQVATILIQKQIRRLPVVDNQLLIGTVSRADICRAVIYSA
ncbi:MAG TPA: CBS domain-containing protein, partial [Anaerolineales bacterium]|nr:CBS domain-containing protein [Anaerolineales bacterium]